jgi:hypothetical protein
VKDFFKGEEKKKEDWAEMEEVHSERIKRWIGSGFNKNNIQVLLCTLQDVLWPNPDWERVGMDKL